MTDVADKRLLSFVERLERLQAEKDAISEDMKEVRKECKSAGYDLPALARLLKRRKLDREERQEQDALDETYQAAIGMLAGTPLGEASAPKKPEQGEDIQVTITTGDKPAKGTISVGRTEESTLPDSAAYGATTAKLETRTISAAPPDRITASVDAVKRQMQAAG